MHLLFSFSSDWLFFFISNMLSREEGGNITKWVLFLFVFISVWILIQNFFKLKAYSVDRKNNALLQDDCRLSAVYEFNTIFQISKITIYTRQVSWTSILSIYYENKNKMSAKELLGIFHSIIFVWVFQIKIFYLSCHCNDSWLLFKIQFYKTVNPSCKLKVRIELGLEYPKIDFKTVTWLILSFFVYFSFLFFYA